MKYKLLLMGTNEVAIVDFFHQMDKEFEMLSTSMHYADIIGHLKYYRPDAIVYCISKTRDDVTARLATLKKETRHSGIPIIILGDKEDCLEFQKLSINVADHMLIKPLTAATIIKEITTLLDMLHAEESAGQIGEGLHLKEIETVEENLPQGDASGDGGPKVEEKKRVLIVDDDIRMLRTLKVLVEEKYTAATAVSGEVALRFVKNKHVDLILLDYEMPQMNGPQVLEKLREKIETSSIPVVFLTGATEREKITTALSMKPQGYLLKPVEREKLMDKLEQLIG